MTNPRVSVVMSSYNHAPFVGQAIESVLRQTFADFEFIVADDGSSDGTPEVIRGFSDPRLTFTAHARNRGAASVTNESLRRCRGEYIARINSDDFWPLDKLAYQVEFLDAHPAYAAMFGDAAFVDAAGAPLTERPHHFAQPNVSRGAWLRRFFDEGNSLCHPTLVIRRACCEELGGYDNRLRQVPDFDMWVRLVKRYAIFVSDRVLTSFRVVPDRNASAPSPENLVRHSAEHFLIAERFFDGVDHALLVEGFGDLLVAPDVPSDIHCDIEKALLFFRPGPYAYLRSIYRVVGLRKLEALLASAGHRDVLRVDYGIDDLAFQRLAGSVDTFTTAFAGGAASAGIADRLPPIANSPSSRGALMEQPTTGEAGTKGEAIRAPDEPWQPIVQDVVAALDDGRLAEGQAACLALLDAFGLPDAGRDLVYAIQAEFAQLLADLVPSATLHELTWPVPADALRRDPSPVLIGERLLVFGRAESAADTPHRSGHHDVLLTLNGDLAIADIVPLADGTGIADHFDDVRPFLHDGHVYATVLLDASGVHGWPQAGIVSVDGGAYRHPHLFGPRAGSFVQGWAPIATPDGPRFLAWWEPTEVLRLDWEEGVFGQVALRRASHVAERFWSGSQGIPAPGGSLFLVNETAILEDVVEIVTTRFVRLDHDFRLTDISPPFFVAARGGDVATGLARQGDRLVAGFTSGEASAVLVTMALGEVLSTLIPLGAPGRRAHCTERGGRAPHQRRAGSSVAPSTHLPDSFL